MYSCKLTGEVLAFTCSSLTRFWQIPSPIVRQATSSAALNDLLTFQSCFTGGIRKLLARGRIEKKLTHCACGSGMRVLLYNRKHDDPLSVSVVLDVFDSIPSHFEGFCPLTFK